MQYNFSKSQYQRTKIILKYHIKPWTNFRSVYSTRTFRILGPLMSIQIGLFLFSAVKNCKYTIPLGEGKKLSSNRRNPANPSNLKCEQIQSCRFRFQTQKLNLHDIVLTHTGVKIDKFRDGKTGSVPTYIYTLSPAAGAIISHSNSNRMPIHFGCSNYWD